MHSLKKRLAMEAGAQRREDISHLRIYITPPLVMPASCSCICWEATNDGASAWVPATHEEDLSKSCRLLTSAWPSPGCTRHVGFASGMD